jgi:nondiscriminating aspartyl-tRNA synthetase
MSTLAELEALHDAQGATVVALKAADKASAATKAAVQELLRIKREITALAPEHKFAMKKKEKKKKKEKAAQGPTKKELRILKKQEAARQKAEAAAAAAAAADNYGDLPLVQSQRITGRTWTRVERLDKALAGRKVLVRGRLHNVRGQAKVSFITLRQSTATVQAVATLGGAIGKEMLKFIGAIPVESVVDVGATVRAAPSAITGCTQSDVELEVASVHVVSKSEITLPFSVKAASLPGSYQYGETDNDTVRGGEAKAEAAAAQQVKVGLDTRLNYRWIDLRTPCNQAIMRINTGVSTLFREYLYARDFVEIHSPKLNGGASEGGANCFTLKYFGQPACLAQSPQLFKQMTAGCGGLERVFEVGPVFRAEDSNTHRHLCEFTGLDMERAINEHYFEVLEMFSGLFINIFEGLNERYAKEIGLVSELFPVEPFKFCKPSLRLTYAEGCQLLADYTLTESDIARGCTSQSPEEDLSTPNEKLLGRIVKAKYGTDFFMMDEYPLKVRPFYTMPHPTNPKLSNSYDFFMRGEEILSGAQRVHDVDKLLERCRTDGGHGEPMSEEAIDSIKGYIDSFRHGALPHGGGGVGLERVVMLFLGLPNIRLASFFPRDPKRLAP